MKVANLFTSVDMVEQRYCLVLNCTSHYRPIRNMFAIVSRLGDGVLWYTLILTLPLLHGSQGLIQAIHIILTGLICLLVYKCLKSRLVRERPYISNANILRAAPALDQYSFPSGHTMHAVMFSTCLSCYLPELAPMFWGFTVMIGLSRVILGLHYPSDVAIGAALGYSLGWVSLHMASLGPVASISFL